jgi:hypothetical protein
VVAALAADPESALRSVIGEKRLLHVPVIDDRRDKLRSDSRSLDHLSRSFGDPCAIRYSV